MSYTVYFNAKIALGWHVCSHIQPKEAVATPLRIQFKLSAHFALDRKAFEIGKLQKYKDISTGITANQYSSNLAIRQAVKSKARVY